MYKELALKLKEAGFPTVTRWEVENNYRRNISVTGEDTMPPLGALLSESRDVVLVQGRGGYAACLNDRVGIGISDGKGYIDMSHLDFFEGETPEEAVANLWLELNKN